MGMTEVGTLRELDVKPGDVVEYTKHGNGGHRTFAGYGHEWAFDIYGEDMVDTSPYWRIISRASDKPKVWRDMTDAEKGALLLAMHDGKVIENKSEWSDWIATTPYWDENYAYRVRPEPKIEVVRQGYKSNVKGQFVTTSSVDHATHIVTFNTIDGKPDPTSIKMEAL